MSQNSNDNDVPARAGYRNPPVEHRFRKGVSGNPKGRPRKPRTGPTAAEIDEIVLAEAYRTVSVSDGGRTEVMPAIQAAVRVLGAMAIKGDRGAQVTFAGLVQGVEARREAERAVLVDQALEYKASWEEAFAHCDRRGLPRPEALPHPDDVVIDPVTGEVRIVGPYDARSKQTWDRLLDRKREALEAIAEYQDLAARNPSLAETLNEDIAHEQRIHAMIDQRIPDRRVRRAARRGG